MAAAVGAVGLLPAGGRAGTFVWDNTTGNWSDPARWGGTAPASSPANTLQFGSGAADYTSTNNIGTGFQLNRMDLVAAPARTNVITASALANTLDFVVNGATNPQVNLSGGGTFRIANNVRVDAGANLAATVAAGGYLVFSTAATPAGATAHSIAPVATTTPSTFTLDGGGTVVVRNLTTTNVAVNNGLLTTDADGDLFGASTDLAIGAQGIVDSGGFTEGWNSLAGSAGAILRGSATMSVSAASGTYRYDGIMANRAAVGADARVNVPGFGLVGNAGTAAAQNTMAFTKAGAHTLTLTGASTYSGTTTVSAGTLVYAGDPVAAATTKGFPTGTITSSPFGTGTLVLSGTGAVSVDAGQNRTIANLVTLSALATGSTGVAVDVPAGSELTTTGEVTYTGTVNKTGAGLWRVGGGDGTANLASVLNVNGGTVRLTDVAGGDMNPTAINVNSGGTYEFGTEPLLGGTENPDLPAETYVTANAGSTVTWNAGEDFGGLVMNGGAVGMRGNINLTGARASDFRTGTISLLGNAPTMGGTQAVNKTGPGTVTITGIPLVNAGGVNFQEGVLSTDVGFPGTAGPLTFGVAANGSVAATNGTLRWAGTGTDGAIARQVTLTTGGGTIDVAEPPAVLTLTGVAGGAGGLTKAGPGTLALGAPNTYTGGTAVAAGTLQVGNGASGGSIAGDATVAAGATLAFNRADAALVYAGNVSGAGGVSKVGAGTVTLTGALTHTGPTAVGAGTLRVSPGTLGGAASVAGGATLAVASPTGAAGTLTVPALSLGAGGATLRFELDQSAVPAAALLNVTGANGLTLSGATHTIVFADQQAPAVGTIPLIDYAGTAVTTGFTLAPLPARVQGGLVYNAAATRIDLNITGSDTIKWNGNATVNWDVGTAVNAGGTQNFKLASTSAATNFVQNDAVAFDDTATGPAGTAVSLTTQLQPAAVTVSNAAKAYTFQGPGSLTGSMPLLKQGTGSLTVLTANAYTGGTTVAGGTLTIGNGGSTGDIGTGPLVNNATVVWNRDAISFAAPITNNGTLTKSGGSTMTLTGTLTGTGTVNLEGGNLSLTPPADYAYAGTIAGAGSLTKVGTATLTLAGNNTYAGETRVESGPLQIGNGGPAGAVAGNITVVDISGSGGALLFNRAGTVTIPGNIFTSGRVANVGPGNTVLTGVLAQDPISVPIPAIAAEAGTLTLANPDVSNIFGGLSAAVGGTLAFDTTAGNQLHETVISGGGTLLKVGTGTLVLTGANTFGGVVRIDAGTLRQSDPTPSPDFSGGNLNASEIIVNNGGTYEFGQGGVTGEDPNLPSNTLVTINAGGTAVWRVGESLGAVNLQGGTLNLMGAAPSGGGLVLGNWTGGTLTGTSASPGVTAIGMGGNAVNKTTPDIVTVNGDATITFTMNILDGTVAYANAINLGGAAVTLGVAGTGGTTGTFEYQGATPAAARAGNFTFNGPGVVRVAQPGTNLSLSGVMGGAGRMTKDGPGTLTLTGINTLTGGVAVSAGRLLVNGQTGTNSGTGTGAVTVAAGGTLGGNGTIAGALALSGRLAPGAVTAVGSASVAGALALASSVSFAATSVFDVQLGGAGAAPVAGTDYDQLVVRGTGTAVTIVDGARLSVAPLAGAAFADGQVFRVLDRTATGTLTIAGTFRDANGTPLPQGSYVGAGAQFFQVSYAGGDLTLTAVPEPAAAAVAAAAALG
ncbi:MAG: Extracellular serine protease precursor, partial [Phycisphaerales bacterium]|nr:Extracellular serine protease precursor [Phycisphaerales bacterium]